MRFVAPTFFFALGLGAASTAVARQDAHNTMAIAVDGDRLLQHVEQRDGDDRGAADMAPTPVAVLIWNPRP